MAYSKRAGAQWYFRRECQEFTKSSQKISTHPLTVLIISVIVQLEQRKGDRMEEMIEHPDQIPLTGFEKTR